MERVVSPIRWLSVASALILGATTSLAQDAKPATTFTGDLGFVSATGNTDLTTLSAGEKLGHSEGRWLFGEFASYVYGETSKKESANLLRFGARTDFALQARFGFFAGATWERNRFAGYNSRVDEFAGAFWKAIVAPEDSLSLEAGGELTQQQNVDSTSDNSPSARFGLNYKHAFTKTAYFQELGAYIPNLKTSGAYRVNSETSLVAPLSAHIAMKLSYVVRYDSNPPATFGTTDRILTTGVQISY